VYRKKKFKNKEDGEIDSMKGRHAFNKQVLSTQRTHKGYTMRPPPVLSERLLKKMAETRGYPGPDKASGKTTFGKQNISRNTSAPRYTFGQGFKA
jgi:hypothetical protein